MANLVITSTVNAIKCDFGIYSSYLKINKGTWPKDMIGKVYLKDDYVEVITKSPKKWSLSFESNNVDAMIVDSVDGQQPNSLEDLYNKISGVIE